MGEPAAIARSVAMSLGNQEAPRSILASGKSFPEDLVMKLFLRPFFLFREFKKSSCQLMAKGCALSTGYLPRGGLPRNSVDRITDRPDMTSAVDRGRKASTQTNKAKSLDWYVPYQHVEVHIFGTITSCFLSSCKGTHKTKSHKHNT